MAYYAFFIEGIEVAWTDKSWCKMRKKQKDKNKQTKKTKNKKTSKMFTKKLKQMSSACPISQSLLSSVVNMFQMTFSWEKKNLYNVVECEGQLSPRHRRLKAASAGVVIRRFICASITENFEHPGTRYPPPQWYFSENNFCRTVCFFRYI